MGFQRSTLRIVFDPGSEFEGLEVRSRRWSIREIVELSQIASTVEDSVEDLDRCLELLHGKLIDWNYDDERGARVPLTVAALGDLDPSMLRAIMRGIRDAAAGVSGPLVTPSTDGDIEASLPMELLHDNPEN